MWQLLLLPACLAFHLVPNPPASMTRESTVVKWVNVSQDHFDTSNTATFPLRFVYSDLFSGENIVVFVGGLWETSTDFQPDGMPYDLAKKVGAGLFYPEHRFYGQTRPTKSATLEELKYLSPEQALGDMAQFLQHIKSDSFENGRYKNGKVALMGCGYAASLATWMKLKYPDMVNAVFADSATLTAVADYPQYLEVVSESMRTVGGQECVDSIQEGLDGLMKLLETAEGRKTVETMYYTCEPLGTKPEDFYSFLSDGVVDPFSNMVQNIDWAIPEQCGILTNSSVSDPVQRLANYVAQIRRPEYCLTATYRDLIAGQKTTSLDDFYTSSRLWYYQTCKHFGWFKSTTSDNQIFRKVVPLEFLQNICVDLFSDEFTPEYINAGIKYTNEKLGANIPDHVVSARGSLDPYYPVGAQPTNRPEAPVYTIEGSSICSVFGSSVTNGTSELETKRRAIFEDLVRFMTT